MFLTLLSSGLGVTLGAYLTNKYNQEAKFQEMKVQQYLNKHAKYNQLWDRLVDVQAVVLRTPNFVARWNARDPIIHSHLTSTLFGAHDAYRAIDPLMSSQMGALHEYLTRYLVSARLLGPMDVPKPISEEIRNAILERYDATMQLTMDWIKIECNQEAIEALLYKDVNSFNKAINGYKDKVKKFIADHPELETIEKIIQEPKS